MCEREDSRTHRWNAERPQLDERAQRGTAAPHTPPGAPASPRASLASTQHKRSTPKRATAAATSIEHIRKQTVSQFVRVPEHATRRMSQRTGASEETHKSYMCRKRASWTGARSRGGQHPSIGRGQTRAKRRVPTTACSLVVPTKGGVHRAVLWWVMCARQSARVNRHQAAATAPASRVVCCCRTLQPSPRAVRRTAAIATRPRQGWARRGCSARARAQRRATCRRGRAFRRF